jgi:subtilase family serine protease
MKIPRFSPRLTRFLVAIAALLALVGSAFVPQATTYAASASGTQKFDPHSALDIRPLWKYAQKYNASGSNIPSCLTSPTPPRCYSPQQIRNAYNIQPLLNAGITGKGRTIVIIDFATSTTLRSDVHLYDQLYGLKDPTINVYSPSGPPSVDPGFYVETALDVEMAHSLAPDATIDLVLVNVDFASSPEQFLGLALSATKYAIDNNLGDVISQSFGLGESCAGSAYLQQEQLVFSEAKAKHITLLASSGDSGAAALICPSFFEGLGVDIPAADPLVTSVGGTSLDATLNTGKYVAETTWNEDATGNGATGGGVSTIFSVPSYQSGISGLTGRGIPDVAFDADPLTGVPIVVSQNGATIIAPIGGTSVGSPAWAGIVALANQYAGKRLGYLNPTLYNILASSSYANVFHDITTGNNTVTGFGPSGPITITGYNAGPGWDAVTGVGTPKTNSLVHLLARFSNS